MPDPELLAKAIQVVNWLKSEGFEDKTKQPVFRQLITHMGKKVWVMDKDKLTVRIAVVDEMANLRKLDPKTGQPVMEKVKKVKVGITTFGSEHGTDNLVNGAELATKNNPDIQIVLIGPKVDSKLEIVEVNSEEEMHTTMEKLLDEKYIQACVTMHYNFPIGVSISLFFR